MNSNDQLDEGILISYLYGELNPQETTRLDEYFLTHPEELKKIQEFAVARDLMGALPDKEVITPPVFMDDHSRTRPLWQNVWFKSVVGIAASFLLLMIAGRIVGMEINYRQGELRITFGGNAREVSDPLPTGELAVRD